MHFHLYSVQVVLPLLELKENFDCAVHIPTTLRTPCMQQKTNMCEFITGKVNYIFI